MSFLVAAALAIGLFVTAPLVAHLLRRGRAKEQPFPPARLVPQARSVARQRARIEDRLLLALRALAVLLLAVLGATPLLRCSRLSLARDAGASVALAVVVDDSLSMRGKLRSGSSRFERARAAALELVASARRGDSVSIVLAGRPARVALAPTTDLEAARRVIADLRASDRATDVEGAVELGRGLVAELPQRDRQLVVLSDFAAPPPRPGQPAIWAPLGELAAAIDDCGVASAERDGARIEALVVCTSQRAAEGRKLEGFGGDVLAENARPGAALGAVGLAARSGAQTLSLSIPVDREILGVRLTGSDDLERDDAAVVARQSSSLAVAVQADPTRASASTGGPTLIEQALAALGTDLSVRPIAIVPDEANALSGVAALVLDDPGGLGPEVRRALETWVGGGGVALALLGPRAEQRELGSTLEPFAQGALPWETTTAKGLEAETLAWLGPEAEGLRELRPHGRVRLEGSQLPGTHVNARWSDGAAFLLERELGRGYVLAAGLPSSPEASDFALRPGFLALLDHVLSLARERSGQRRSLPGATWRFPVAGKVEVLGPSGPLVPKETEGQAGKKQYAFTPELSGRYRVGTPEGTEERAVGLDADEIQAAPRPPAAESAAHARSGKRPEVDASAETVWLLLALVGFEVLLRGARLWLGRQRVREPAE